MNDIVSFVVRRKSGWPNAMHAVPLGDGALVHSPTWIDDEVTNRVAELEPRVLFAPNHFHHLALRRYRARFPKAIVAASQGAKPRLEKQGVTDITSLESIALPKGVRFLVPEGTKNGEAWLAIDEPLGTTWIVCDAFFNEVAPVAGLEGAFLRMAKISPGLCIGATFTLLCVGDRKRYVAWVQAALERDKPRRILFSHGNPLDADAVARLGAVLSDRLG